jgi:putative transcriptional regulator
MTIMSADTPLPKRKTLLADSRLAVARSLAGINQGELGRAIGRSAAWVSQVEHGRFVPTYQQQVEIARALGMPMEDLFERDED